MIKSDYIEENKRVISDENPNDVNQIVEISTTSKGEYPTLVGLSEKEQKSSAAWKWAISENTRLQEYETKYHELKESFHKVHESFEVFKAKNSNNPLLDTISCILFALGPLALGWLSSISDSKTKFLIAIVGVGILAAAVTIKIVQYFKS